MTGLILKLSYNRVGETPVEGGICGSAFVLNSSEAITAHHVLNTSNFKPNSGFTKCQFWLLCEPNFILELKKEDLTNFSEMETTLIGLKKIFKGQLREMDFGVPNVNTECYNEGFKGGLMPTLDAKWGPKGLVINSFSSKNVKIKAEGFIKSKKILNVNTNDMVLTNIKGLETSYGGIVGMSGGPLIDKQANKVIGLMSIGLPQDIPVKETLFAVSILEIVEKLKINV